MGHRIGVMLVSCALLPIVAFIALTFRDVAAMSARSMTEQLTGVSRSSAADLRSRLGAAEAIAQTLTARDIGYDGSALKQQIANSRAFKSVVVVDRDGLLADGGTALQPSPAQRLALETGQTVLMSVTFGGQQPAIFMVRPVNAAGFERLAYFELAPDWLWKDLLIGQTAAPIAIVDAEGRVLRSTSHLPDTAGALLARQVTTPENRGQGVHVFPLEIGGETWKGALAHVPMASERITAAPWAVIAYGPSAPYVTALALLSQGMQLAAAIALLGAIGATLYLVRSYLPPLMRLQEALSALRARRFEPVPVEGTDEPRKLVETFNLGAAGLREYFRGVDTMSQIDRLLLSPAEFEQVIDAILSCVQSTIQCDVAGITLRDPDASGHGRVYLAASGLTELPVSRVTLQDSALDRLASEADEVTIVHGDHARHAFLKPLAELGAEYFRLWPVLVANRVEAILALGYRELPAADPRIDRYGGEFAERLAVALSKSARDADLYRQAHYDPLTALPNRVLFRDRLAQELTSAIASESRGALLYIDLDHFKRVNDTVGHSAGDQLLTIVAQRLRASVKEGDTVARLAGDEFTVILRNIQDADAAEAVAERIVESLQQPVSVGGRDHYICASIGIAIFPEDGSTLDELMRNADTAMYRAKELGRGRIMFFNRDMTPKPAAATESGLHRALRRREFSLLYQPQFHVRDGSLAGMEALLRWHTPREGIRNPGDFVAAAEETGMMVDIDGWVLDAACSQLAGWRDEGIAPPRLALNVSVQQLLHPEFPKLLRRVLDKYGLPAGLIELELCESVFANEVASASLGRLGQLGVHLVLDELGTGYSSLSHLRQYPIESLKIDRAFMQEVPQNPTRTSHVETVIVMAHALGKRVLAEGVETIEQLDFLRERHCDVAQGFYMAKPLTAAAMGELLRARMIAGSDFDARAAG